MAYGYSQQTIEANKKADDSMLGVALGRACIAKNISVTFVAAKLGVSRATVYSWFEGKYSPRPELVRSVKGLVAALNRKH